MLSYLGRCQSRRYNPHVLRELKVLTRSELRRWLTVRTTATSRGITGGLTTTALGKGKRDMGDFHFGCQS